MREGRLCLFRVYARRFIDDIESFLSATFLMARARSERCGEKEFKRSRKFTSNGLAASI